MTWIQEQWEYNRVEWSFFGGLVLIVALVFWAFAADAEKLAAEKQAFVQDCVQDLPQYECLVKWGQYRAGTKGPDVVPVPIIIPMGR